MADAALGPLTAPITKDDLSFLDVDGWPEYSKKVLTRATRVNGPFQVETSEGTLSCRDVRRGHAGCRVDDQAARGAGRRSRAALLGASGPTEPRRSLDPRGRQVPRRAGLPPGQEANHDEGGHALMERTATIVLDDGTGEIRTESGDGTVAEWIQARLGTHVPGATPALAEELAAAKEHAGLSDPALEPWYPPATLRDICIAKQYGVLTADVATQAATELLRRSKLVEGAA